MKDPDDSEAHLWLPPTDPERQVTDWTGFFADEAEDESLADYRMPRETYADRVREWLVEEREVGTPFLFAPVLFGLGAILYFLAPREPLGWAVLVLAAAAVGRVAGVVGRPANRAE